MGMIDYNESPLPPKRPGGMAVERDENAHIDTVGGNLQYRSGAATGHVEIEIPSLPGHSAPTERLHARDFPRHVLGKVESAFNRQPYMRTGPQQSPVETFQHYAAVARGARLIDAASLRRMEELGREFEAASDRQAYYEQSIRPYLLGFAPKRRQP